MVSGELFEFRLETASGVVEVLAEIRVAGDELELRDIVVYPAGDERLAIGAAALLAAARSQVFPRTHRAGRSECAGDGNAPDGFTSRS